MKPIRWSDQKRFSIAVCILLVSLATVSMTIGKPKIIIPLPQHQNQSESGELPIVDYSAMRVEDAITAHARQAKSRKYEKRPNPIQEYEGKLVELPLHSHWDWGITSLPSDKSSVIVIGQIIDASAYLTSDRSNVYSEFSLQPSEIIKNSNGLPIYAGEIISITREGGAVRFASGKIQQYRIHNQQMPATGRTYLMFLKGDSIETLSIITGYEMREGKVHPLDKSQQFSVYAATNQVDFLNAVRDSMKGDR